MLNTRSWTFSKPGHTDVNKRDIEVDGKSKYDLTEEEDRNALLTLLAQFKLPITIVDDGWEL